MKTDRIKLMSEAPVSKALFQLGIPMVISMLVTALYNVVHILFPALENRQWPLYQLPFPFP